MTDLLKVVLTVDHFGGILISINSRKVKEILGLVATLNSTGLSSADGNHDGNVHRNDNE